MIFMMIGLAGLAITGDIYDDTPMTINPDPDYVPGTYEEWLEGQPDYEPFSARTIQKSDDSTELILIFEEGLTDSLEAGLLDQWTGDMASQGLTTEVVEVTYSTPEELKDYLTGLYNDGLEGAVLIGNLPVAWCILDDAFLKAGEYFPSDYFLMDLNGVWEDLWIGYPSQSNPGADGKYDTFSGSLDPEIYVGRIKVDNLTAVGDPTEILNDYLQRNHEWRENGDPEPLTALCYVDDDWAAWGGGYQNSMEYLYPNTVLVNHPDSTNGTDYLENRLPDNYVWISPYVHSSPITHYWSPGPSTQWNQIIPANPQAHFYNLFACSNCRFTTARCMGAVYTFGTSTGLATIGSTKSGSMLVFYYFYSPLGAGASMGEGYQDWWDYIALGGLSPSELSWHLGMVLLGDPTLMPAMHMLGIEEQSGDTENLHDLTFAENPCRSEIVISYPADHGSVELFDTSGRLVATGNLEDSSCTLQVSALGTGFYIARVQVEDGSATASVVILK